MGEHQVFDSIQSDIYDLCRFYILGMTGDPPEFSTPWEPATCGHIRDLLKSACAIGQPYMILVHSADSVTAVSMLRDLHTAACLQCLQVDLRGKSVKLSFCPLVLTLGGGGGEQPVIPKSHHHSALQCQLWVREVSEADLCIVLSLAQPQESVHRAGLQEVHQGSDGKPSSGTGGDNDHGGSSRATPKKDSKAPTADSQGFSTLPASQSSPRHS